MSMSSKPKMTVRLIFKKIDIKKEFMLIYLTVKRTRDYNLKPWRIKWLKKKYFFYSMICVDHGLSSKDLLSKKICVSTN